MANEAKSAAELAREERKARIGKAGDAMAEKREKKANQSKRQKRLKWIIPAVVIVIALVLGLLYYFGVPHRALSVIRFGNGEKVSIAEYEYYYKAVYNNISNSSYQYEQYYGAYYGEGAGKMMTGFDYKKTPKNQEFTLSEADTGIKLDKKEYGENPTWADFFKEYSIKQAQEITAVYNAAVKDGAKLSDDQIKEINKNIEDLRKSAAESNYSLNAYLMANYGRGMNESLLRKIMQKQALASSYIQNKSEEIQSGITDDQILAYYDEHTNEYNTVDLYFYTLEAEAAKNTEAQEVTDTTEAVEATNYTDEELAEMTKKNLEEKKAEAEAFYEKATIDNFLNLVYESVEEDMKEYFNPSSDSYNDSYTTASAVNYSTIEKSFSKDVADWAYDSSRAVGDKFMTSVKADDGCTTFIIVVLKSLPYKNDTLQPVNVRHILLALTKDEEVTDDKGNKTTETKTIRTPEEAMEQAQAILDKWVKDGAKEDDFIKLAAEKSEDPGSADNGGLIEGIYTDSSYVKPFLDWAYADGRKVGDYGVVETDYGAHIMYMSSISDKTKWQADILTAMSNDASNKFYEDIVNDKAYSEIKVSNGLIKKVQNKIEDYAARVVETFEKQSAQQAGSSAANS